MNRENRALKEIEESRILVDYLIHHDLDFENIKNFTSKTVQKAVEWHKDKDATSITGMVITNCLLTQFDRKEGEWF